MPPIRLSCLYVCTWLRPYSTCQSCLYIVIALYYPLLTHSLSRNTRFTKVISSICTLYPQMWCFVFFVLQYFETKLCKKCVKIVVPYKNKKNSIIHFICVFFREYSKIFFWTCNFLCFRIFETTIFSEIWS